MTDWLKIVDERKEEVQILSSKIASIKGKFTKMFTPSPNLIPSCSISYDKSQFEINFNEHTLKLESNPTLHYKVGIKHNKLDFVSSMSFGNKKLENHDLEEVIKFNEIAVKVAETIKKLDKEKIIEYILEIKSIKKRLNQIQKELSQIKTEMAKEESKTELKQIFNIIKPVGWFCIDSLLCEKYGIKIENDKPNRKDVKLLKEKIKENIKKSGEDKRYKYSDINLMRIPVTYFEMKEGKIKFFSNDLKVEMDKEFNFKYYLSWTKLSKKRLNELLSNQFFYKEQVVTDLDEMGLRSRQGFSAQELKEKFQKEITQEIINKF